MELSEEVKALGKKMDRILAILESDEKFKQEGMVEKVNRHDSEIKEIQTSQKISKAQLLIASGIGAAAIQILGFLLGQLFK